MILVAVIFMVHKLPNQSTNPNQSGEGHEDNLLIGGI